MSDILCSAALWLGVDWDRCKGFTVATKFDTPVGAGCGKQEPTSRGTKAKQESEEVSVMEKTEVDFLIRDLFIIIRHGDIGKVDFFKSNYMVFDKITKLSDKAVELLVQKLAREARDENDTAAIYALMVVAKQRGSKYVMGYLNEFSRAKDINIQEAALTIRYLIEPTEENMAAVEKAVRERKSIEEGMRKIEEEKLKGIEEFQAKQLQRAKELYVELAKIDPENISYDEHKKIEEIAGQFVEIANELIVKKLIEDLDTKNKVLVENAIIALGKLQEKKAVPKLIRIYQETADKKWTSNLGKLAAESLGQIADPRAIPVLLANVMETYRYHGPTYGYEQQAAKAIKAIGEKIDIALALIEIFRKASNEEYDFLHDPYSVIAAVYLAPINNSQIQDALVTLLLVEKGSLPSNVDYWILTRFKEISDEKDIRRLAPLIKEKVAKLSGSFFYEVAEPAIKLLSAWRIEGFQSKMIELLRNPKTEMPVVSAAALYLGEVGDKEALAPLESYFGTTAIYCNREGRCSEIERSAAWAAYGKILSRNPGEIPLEKFKAADLQVQIGILVALREIPDCPQKQAIIEYASQSQNANVRFQSQVLREGEEKALADLEASVFTPKQREEAVREFAKLVLAKLKDKKERKELRRILKEEKDEEFFLLASRKEDGRLELAYDILKDKSKPIALRAIALKIIGKAIKPSDLSPFDMFHKIFRDEDEHPFLKVEGIRIINSLYVSPL